MAPTIARADRVGRAELTEFLSSRHRALLVTTRRDGGAQTSPVTCGVDGAGRLVVSTYPSRSKVTNIRHTGHATACVLSDDWNGPWVQVEGPAEVLDLPEPSTDSWSTSGASPASTRTGRNTGRPWCARASA